MSDTIDMSDEFLAPTPHYMKALKARHWSLAGALEELFDNSIAHGNAGYVSAMIYNTVCITVSDDGIGMDDLNRLYQLGNTSGYDDLSQIGQFGAGGGHACFWLGDEVTTTTVHDGVKHEYTWDWSDESTWPRRYRGEGTPVPVAERFNHWGTKIRIAKLRQYYTRATIQNCARELGLIFAPALRRGVDLRLYHHLVSGDSERIEVKAFNPTLTDEIEISGEVERHSNIRELEPLRWTGRAGICESLTEKQGGVHIAFMHRVIEHTKDPFKGRSAPNLYVEVQLDETTRWKYMLSTHKDKIVKYRDDLINSIYEQIKDLVDKAAQQTQDMQLDIMVAPVAETITMALRAAGVLYVDPGEDPSPGGQGKRGGPGPSNPGGPNGRKLRRKATEGDAAKPAQGPAGIKFDWRTRDQLEGKAYSWMFSGNLMTVLLDRDMFVDLINWRERERAHLTLHLLAGPVSQAIEFEFLHGNAVIKSVITPAFYQQVEEWANDNEIIAPHLYRTIIDRANRPGK